VRFSLTTSLVSLGSGERRWDLEGYLGDCRLAEELGFFGFYKGERRGHGSVSGQHGAVTSAVILASHGLAATEHLTFATNIVILPLHHPTVLIQDATVLNALYPGRFRLGVGAGYNEDDLEVVGASRKRRPEYMRVGLEAMAAFRSGRPYAFAPDAPWQGVVPPADPAMGELRPEILVGAWTPAGARLAAGGDAWLSGPISRVEQLAHLAGIYRTRCRKRGKASRVIVMRDGAIGSTQRAAGVLADNIVAYHRIYFARGGAYDARWEPTLRSVSRAEDLDRDTVIAQRVLCGTPEDWVTTLKCWEEELEMEEVVIRLGFFHGPSRDVVHRQMRLIAEEVMPAFL
jgi:alkanesulfonate monooxygenase SsuD/methylene tetrahydromethanopterin reductase-like flavin-dependent oxidoreductase (luciferase family)